MNQNLSAAEMRVNGFTYPSLAQALPKVQDIAIIAKAASLAEAPGTTTAGSSGATFGNVAQQGLALKRWDPGLIECARQALLRGGL